MATFSGKRGKDKAVNAEIETSEDDIALPGEEGFEEEIPTVVVEPTNDQRDYMAELNDALPATEEENTAMPETTNAPVAESSLDNEAESLLTDATKAVQERAESKTVELLSVDSLPASFKVGKMQLSILDELAEEYKALFKELAEGTSNKDEKVEAYIANLDTSGDEEGLILRDAFAEAQEARAKAIAAENAAREALQAHVETELAKAPNGGVMSEEDIAAKTAEIKAKYAEYSDQYKAARNFFENHRAHKDSTIGTIEQYVTHIDRPSGRPTKGGANATRSVGASTGSRSVHVSGAEWSEDGGATWTRATKDTKTPSGMITLSNPAELASALGKRFKTVVNKDDIVDAWYSAAGQSRETASKANMPDVQTFEFDAKDGDKSNPILVRLTKRQ